MWFCACWAAQVLFDLGAVSGSEPFQRLVSQGMILGETEYTVWRGSGGEPAEPESPGAIPTRCPHRIGSHLRCGAACAQWYCAFAAAQFASSFRGGHRRCISKCCRRPTSCCHHHLCSPAAVPRLCATGSADAPVRLFTATTTVNWSTDSNPRCYTRQKRGRAGH